MCARVCLCFQVTVLYFLRNRTDKDVDASRMERDVFCGELKHNTIEALSSLLSDIYIPITRAQKDWGDCNDEGQSHLMHSMDKFVIALNETAASMRHSRQWVSLSHDDTLNVFFKMFFFLIIFFWFFCFVFHPFFLAFFFHSFIFRT